MDEQVSSCGEGVTKGEADIGPPVLQSQSEDSESDEPDSSQPHLTQEATHVDSAAPVLSVMKVPEVGPENALRSPPKLLPAVVSPKSKSDDAKTPNKPLTGSMKNTPASLSIIEAPAMSVGKSTRSTRSSIDPSFAAKQRSFLNKVHNALSSTHYIDVDETSSCGSEHDIIPDIEVSDDKSPEYVPGLEEVSKKLLNGMKRRREEPVTKSRVITTLDHTATNEQPANEVLKEPSPKKWAPQTVLDGKLTDSYCWYCHRENTELFCASCPRGFHSRCLRKPLSSNPEEEWVCIECVTILKAENQETRSKALKMLSLDQLCKLLLYAVNRMKSCIGAEVFENAVDVEQFPSYKEHIINPMYLSLLEKNIRKKMYGSTEAFIADSMWILHNCIIFNSFNSKLTSTAKTIMKMCKQEMAEIENCPDCYYYAYTEDEYWFIKVCQKPHLLVWAKLKGFPYWPAKVIRSNADSIDVRFFGAHDRAWVPCKDCYLYSRENPNSNTSGKLTPTNVQQKKRSSRNNLDTCIEEVELHIKLLQKRFTTFQYAHHRAQVHIKKLDDHLKFMLPDLKSADVSCPDVTKNPLKKHGSFEMESATIGPASKRMKADSSLTHSSKNAMENGETKESPALKAGVKETYKSGTKGIVSSLVTANSSTENITTALKENGTSASKSNGTTVPQSNDCDVKSPAIKRGSFASPTPSSEVSTISELRLKKKDARKIGLVDRLQEKLNNMLRTQSSEELSSIEDDPNANETEYLKKNESEENVNDIKDSSTSSVNGELSENILASDEDVQSPERKALLQEAVKNIMDSFKLIENQPKVVLTKLDLGFNNKSGENAVKHEIISSEDEVDSDDDSKTSDKTEKVVSEVYLIPADTNSECVDDSTEESETNVTSQPASQPKTVQKDLTTIDDVPKSLKPGVLSGELKTKLSEVQTKLNAGVLAKTHVKPVKERSSKPKPLSVTLLTNNGNGSVTESPIDLDVAKRASSESPVKSNDKGSSELESKAPCKVGKNTTIKTLDMCASQTSNGSPGNSNTSVKTVKIPLGLKRKGEPILLPTKVITKPLFIRAKQKPDLSEPNETEDSGSVSSESMKTTRTEEADISNTSVSSPSNSDGPLKSLLSNNVTVFMEPSIQQNSPEVKSDSENPLVIVTSPEPDATSTKSSNTSRDKITEAENQLEKDKRLTLSPPKIASPPIISTPPRQLMKMSPTSVLKPKVSPASETSSETSSVNTANASQIMAAQNNTAAPNPQFLKVPISALRPSSIVTVSAATGRRLLPKAVPIVIRAPTQNTSIGSSPSSVNSIAIASRISVSPLVTPVSSAAVPPLVSGPQAMESVLKKSVQFNMVPKLTAAPTSLRNFQREMPPLSLATVSSLKSFSTTTTNAGCRLITETASSGTRMSSSESLSNLCVGEKPVAMELKSQAQKMTHVFLESMKDFLSGMGSSGSLEAQVRSLQHDIEILQWRHQQELAELQHNSELAIAEVRDRMKIESQRAVYLAVANERKEKEAAVAAAKEKQWCAYCKKEAMFYCCWNTSYCDYQCQQNHWRVHSLTCTQNSVSSTEPPQSSCGDSSQTQRGTPTRLSN